MDRQQILSIIKPEISDNEFIELVNRIFHKYEAKYYDKIHREVYEQLPALWRRMLLKAVESTGRKVFRILDFGCGTGFEARQAIDFFGPENIEYLVCFDIARQMLDICKKKIGKSIPEAVYTSSPETVSMAAAEKPFDIIITNSLLHHLPDWQSQVREFHGLLAENGVWLNGHEPSARFYKNPDCLELFTAYLKYLKRTRYLNKDNYIRKFKDMLGLSPGMYRQAADEVNELGVLKNRITPQWAGLLVDYHVPLNEQEARSSSLDPLEMKREFIPFFECLFLETYSYMGYFFESGISKRWQAKCTHLGSLYPDDGANFCAVWRKCG